MRARGSAGAGRGWHKHSRQRGRLGMARERDRVKALGRECVHVVAYVLHQHPHRSMQLLVSRVDSAIWVHSHVYSLAFRTGCSQSVVMHTYT